MTYNAPLTIALAYLCSREAKMLVDIDQPTQLLSQRSNIYRNALVPYQRRLFAESTQTTRITCMDLSCFSIIVDFYPATDGRWTKRSPADRLINVLREREGDAMFIWQLHFSESERLGIGGHDSRRELLWRENGSRMRACRRTGRIKYSVIYTFLCSRSYLLFTISRILLRTILMKLLCCVQLIILSRNIAVCVS